MYRGHPAANGQWYDAAAATHTSLQHTLDRLGIEKTRVAKLRVIFLLSAPAQCKARRKQTCYRGSALMRAAHNTRQQNLVQPIQKRPMMTQRIWCKQEPRGQRDRDASSASSPVSRFLTGGLMPSSLGWDCASTTSRDSPVILRRFDDDRGTERRWCTPIKNNASSYFFALQRVLI